MSQPHSVLICRSAPPAVQILGSACPVERLAYHFAAYADAHRSISEKALHCSPSEAEQAEALMSRIDAEMTDIREAVSQQQGRTVIAAMFHLMVADCEADLLDVDSDPTPEEIKTHLQRVKNNLHSAVTVLEGLTGMSREEFGGVYLMPQRHNLSVTTN